MGTLSSWLGPMRRLGNAGAVANADRACRQRVQAEASTDADLRKTLKVPHTLAEMGVKESDAKSIAADAVKDPTAGSNPRKLSQADFEALTLAAIRGDLGNRA